MTFVNDDDPIPKRDCQGTKIRLEKIEPFTMKKRKMYNIGPSDKISETLCNSQKGNYPREFKEYFEQNFKNQFFKTSRDLNKEMKQMF